MEEVLIGGVGGFFIIIGMGGSWVRGMVGVEGVVLWLLHRALC